MPVKEQFIRGVGVLGEDGINKLNNSKVIIFVVGGVGGFCAEALCRAGFGHIDIVDGDVVSVSNLNRQIIALHSTVGRSKVEVLRERLLDINPECKVSAHKLFYLPENADSIDLSRYDYIVDAVDTVSAKLEIICRAKALDIPIISAMGAGNKLDPTRFEVADIYKTSVCPLSRIIRRELKARGVKSLKVVYSKEEPRQSMGINAESGKPIPSSLAFVPSVMGLIMAGEIVCDITGTR